MAEESMTFLDVIGQQGGEDFLRTLVERVLEQLMEFEVANRIGASRHERTEDRQAYRNGHRERPLHTRVGTLELKVPKIAERDLFPVLSGAEEAVGAGIGSGDPGGVDRRPLDPQGG